MTRLCFWATLVAICLFGCREKGQQQASATDNADTVKTEVSNTQNQQPKERLTGIDKNLLKGVWWLNDNDPTALFQTMG